MRISEQGHIQPLREKIIVRIHRRLCRAGHEGGLIHG